MLPSLRGKGLHGNSSMVRVQAGGIETQSSVGLSCAAVGICSGYLTFNDIICCIIPLVIILCFKLGILLEGLVGG